MTFNVDVHRAADEDTLRAVGIADADVVCLEETGPRWEPRLRARYGRRYPYMRFRNHRQWSGGLAVLSKGPIEPLAYMAGIDGYHPALRVLVHTAIGPVQIVEVHLRPMFTRREGWVGSLATVDRAHLVEIRRFMARVRTDVPTIVAGDFNEGPRGAAVRELARRGFRSLLPLFHPGEETWRHPSLLGEIGATIDHIAIDDRLVPLDAHALRVGRSDHVPVVAVLARATGS